MKKIIFLVILSVMTFYGCNPEFRDLLSYIEIDNISAIDTTNGSANIQFDVINSSHINSDVTLNIFIYNNKGVLCAIQTKVTVLQQSTSTKNVYINTFDNPNLSTVRVQIEKVKEEGF